MSEVKSPLRILCRNCGHPVTFDIERQTYRCPMCGTTTGIEEEKKKITELRTLRKKDLYAQRADLMQVRCSGCSAYVIFPTGEVLNQCDFCGSRLVRGDASELGFMPDLVIPFSLTEAEARERLRQWAGKHPKAEETRLIDDALDTIQGYYMPYEIVNGSMEALVNRAGLSRHYRCRGYVEKVAVNGVREMNASLLDAAGPFDLDTAKPFSYAYLAGHRALVSNLSDNDIDRRARRQVAAAYLPTVQKTLQDTDVRMRLISDNLLSMSAMLPVYVLKKGRLSAVVNGQTGRVATAFQDEKKKPFPFWMLEALLYTVITTLLLGIFVSAEWKYLAMFGAFFGLLYFCALGQNRAPIASNIIRKSEEKNRENIRTQTGQEEPPVFYEKINGREIPVEYRFLPMRRILSLVLQSIMFIAAPVITAAVIRGITADNGGLLENIINIDLRGGSIWFIFTISMVAIAVAQIARGEVYNHPFIYERLEGGSRRLTGEAKARRVTIFSMATAGIKRKRHIALVLMGVLITFFISIWGMLAL